jgi:Flp pilus assembly protein TadD
MARRRKKNRPAAKSSNKNKTEAAQESTSDKSSGLKIRIILLGVASVIAVALIIYLAFHNRQPKTSDTTARPAGTVMAATYVGAATCKGCHEAAYNAWRGSHHDLAMQEVSDKSVLGNFANAKFSYAGITSTFFKRDGKFYVNTDGPGGKLADFAINYTFGIHPLQQYLVEFPDGRLQALSIAWDARPTERGGQRWFHLYPKENIRSGDPLHWTGLDQNWNYQCAECHSTNLQKRYNATKAAYDTKWSEINVACEACHGPGSAHVEWGKKNRGKNKSGSDNGLAVQFNERRGVVWTMDETKGIARRSVARATNIEIDACARCHSRRGILTEDYIHGKPLLETHLPALLTEGLYYPDGQIQGEVYEYGSFLQSKMHAAGVTCSDCHEPHSLKLRAEQDGVCSQCHAPAKFASAEHHHHKTNSAGASCLGCHMPERIYMVVDPRRDHGFRVPRPDLSAKLGTPNACAGCHTDKSVDWAANAFAKWYKPTDSAQQRYAEALYAGRSGEAGAEAKLMAVAQDTRVPAIARATALAELRRYLSPKSFIVVQANLKGGDPLARLGALRALEGADPKAHAAASGGLLQDSVRGVRITAASLLAGVSPDTLSASQRTALDRAVREYVAAQQINADRPESRLNLALLFARKGEFKKAEEHYRQALKLQPSFVPAYVNLADLYRAQERDKDGEMVLREAVTAVPEDASVAHALGLLLVREKKVDEAIVWLKRAAERAPEIARYAYVYGVALNSTGRTDRALDTLARAVKRHPNDREILYALTTMSRDAGRLAAARSYAEKLAAVAPDDPGVGELLKVPALEKK